ncbi:MULTISPECIES: DUF2218 domain-containing protein [Acinetobacter]|uniref:DUF2218 domain-containing protein n=1 Tax=Acinetobacter TaxID=469 RepID=UPI001E41A957|nr:MULTISPECIES: DUF2218 domain-containing protein [Acinetobacter]MCD0188640.1 DUF2218 domain-containing protein [Acinetobacter sp. PW68]MCO8055013.1 DUF2218 domain-containing protein [Acinetobacter towneri]MCO8057554.1 DUF2218 domain-containing protein [Acinetobacter towneri]
MNSSAHIQTTQASRIAKRLLNHWKHKFDVVDNATLYQIMMPSATILLTPQTDELVVEIQAKEAETDLSYLEQVVLDHLSRMAQTELSAVWQHH